MSDYQRVAEIIEYLAQNFREQPDLDSLASMVGLSTFHFHRLFRRWAGTTPKTFLQHLTAEEAKRLLRGGDSVLDTALDVGLSGPGRLHDLCVSLEAASPGEIKSGGEGWDITGGFCETPFGQALIAIGPRGVCGFAFVAEAASLNAEWIALQESWPNAKLQRNDESAQTVAQSIFSYDQVRSHREPIRLLVKGTTFQTRVWRALVEIPLGQVRSYTQIAARLASARSARAVGSAVSRNPIAFLIPCHRVIHASGMPGNYHWGATRKRAILAWERSVLDHGRRQDAPLAE